MTAAPRALLAVDGDPQSTATWSGSSRALLAAAPTAGLDLAGVDAGSVALARLEALAGLSPDRETWRQRYHANATVASTAVRRAHSRLLRAPLAALAAELGRPAIVQVGHWFDLSGCAPVVASYSDGNVALQLRRGDLRFDPAGAAARRAAAWEAATARRMDLVLAMSDWLAGSMVDDYGVDPARVHVVGQGPNVPLPEAPPPRPDPARRVLFVGKAFVRKGGPDLLAAWPTVRAALPDAELVLVGPKDLDVPLPAGVRCEGRIDRSAPGGEARLASLFAEACALVLPSRFEPFGTAMLEGMGWGLACVGTRACAMPEVIEDGVTGRLARPGDPASLAEALIDVLGDPRRALALGAAGRARLERDLTWERVAARIADALTRVPVRHEALAR